MNRRIRSLHAVRLYRDTDHGMVMGVCAGLSDQFGFRLGPLRIIALVLLLLFTLPTLLVYVAAGLLLPDRPLRYYGSRDERELWSSGSRRMEA
ncbi:MAG: PspC domain-containing protein [Gammaproteobacteria bacterium]|jgi:phage shock protein C